LILDNLLNDPNFKGNIKKFGEKFARGQSGFFGDIKRHEVYDSHPISPTARLFTTKHKLFGSRQHIIGAYEIGHDYPFYGKISRVMLNSPNKWK
jgi:hypothetical protein